MGLGRTRPRAYHHRLLAVAVGDLLDGRLARGHVPVGDELLRGEHSVGANRHLAVTQRELLASPSESS